MEAIAEKSSVQFGGKAAAAEPRAKVWIGRGMSGLALLFLGLDAFMKLLERPEALEGTAQLGYPAGMVFTIGVIQAVCVIAYAVPRTSVLGAILLTGYLGGAVATHLRLGHPLFSHTLAPIYVAVFVWGGLYLRERALRRCLPLQPKEKA